MANEIVKYRNQINKVSLRNFNSKELDIFMEIISRMRNKDTNEVVFDFWYLKELINWNDNTSISFEKSLKNVYDKLIQCNFSYEDKKEYVKFVLFTMYRIDYNNKTITVKINNDFKPLINFVIGDKNYTRFELEEFVSFKSTYTKEFFRRMKQFSLGFWEVDLQEFKDLLDIPKTYNSSDIDKRVLIPIVEELKDKYNLKIIKKFDKKSLRGRPKLVGYRFEFSINAKASNKNINTNSTEEIDIDNESKSVERFLKLYQFRNLQLYDQKCNRYNSCKILDIKKENDKFVLFLKNNDDSYLSKLDYFKTLKHLSNFIIKYLD